MNKPKIGRIVIYKTTEQDKKNFRDGFEHANVVDELPAVIVNVWSDTCVNVKVLTDGRTQDLWKTSINQGDQAGNWNWPVIE
jgi:hypothetical protein